MLALAMQVNYSNLDVQVTGKYMPRPDLHSMVGMYLLNITLDPQHNVTQRVTGRQRVDVIRIGSLPLFMKEKAELGDDVLFGRVQHSSLPDWGWAFSIDDFVNSSQGNALKYISAIEAFLKNDKTVSGIAFDTSPGSYNLEHWHGMMPTALQQKGFTALDDPLFFYFFLRF